MIGARIIFIVDGIEKRPKKASEYATFVYTLRSNGRLVTIKKEGEQIL